MKVFVRLLIAVVIAALVAGYFYWQQHKKGIIKNAFQQAVQKKTDSLYYLHYDSSHIDEINGNAAFYKVSLQSDSLQKVMLQRNDSLPEALYNISVDEVSAHGIDMAGMLQQQQLSATSIVLNKPIIQVIKTGVENVTPFTYADTLALYKKITGRFKSLHADTIIVTHGTVLITDKNGKPLTTIENINITLNNFLIDSTRNYQHLVSYFINDVKATVENIQSPENKKGNRINVTNLLYDAREKLLQAGTIQQYKKENSTPVSDLKNVRLTGLNTNAFITQQKIMADQLSCAGGLVTIYKKKKKNRSGEAAVEMNTALIDEVHVATIRLGNTKIVIADEDNPLKAPFIINDVQFTASQLASLTDGSTLNDLVNTAAWQLSAGGFSLVTKEGTYRFSAAGLQADNQQHTVKIKQALLQPLLTQAAFAKRNNIQTDLFDMAFSNIDLKGVDFEKLISNNMLATESVALKPVLKIFSDRTLPADTTSKMGKYPHQSILKLPFPFYIHTITVKNGAVYYTEKGEKSGLNGMPYFTNINAVITNVTNVPAKIKDNGLLRLKASTLFLGKATLTTEWLLPLVLKDSSFTVTGQLNAVDATLLNPVIEPLAMASIKSGKINQLNFNLKCNDYKGEGEAVFLYNDLKVEVLKMSDDTLKKKGFVSFLANTLIKNNNPMNNNTYIASINYKRDKDKSFFNLLWKSIFDGVKKTVLRK